ncbi:IS629 transposase [Escherichia coli]|nr:IS629 transposase [Escherichia coli]
MDCVHHIWCPLFSQEFQDLPDGAETTLTYVSLAYMERLKEAKLLASTGSTGDSYDNAMAESINGLYKAEVIHRKSWKKRAEVELATLTWVDWYNNRRLLGRLRHTPPAEAEKAYYASIGNDELAA